MFQKLEQMFILDFFPVKIRNSDNTLTWLLNGKIHRLDGPAVEYADGYQTWYVNHKQNNQFGFWAAVDEFRMSGAKV